MPVALEVLTGADLCSCPFGDRVFLRCSVRGVLGGCGDVLVRLVEFLRGWLVVGSWASVMCTRGGGLLVVCLRRWQPGFSAGSMSDRGWVLGGVPGCRW